MIEKTDQLKLPKGTKRKKWKGRKSLQDLWETIKTNNPHIIRVSEEKREKGTPF